ncbi:hypothetical protein [Paracoccus alkanivorans]|uniref:hypothetical protein n=1 Tax=Paracoccus alkanivorans TaxID=2116655 RepID=UPI0014097885|nr:hypothetical protein [Paracoccus alkanivorans]
MTFGAAMDNLPDFAEMNFGFSAQQAAQLQDYCDELRLEVRRQVESRAVPWCR